MDEYQIERTFMDITDTSLSPNQTKTYQATNPNMTPYTVTSSSTGAQIVREITSVEVIPPQDANGAYEDLREIWLILDNNSYQHYVSLSGVGTSLMTPLRSQVWGGRSFAIPFGEPLWRVVQEQGQNMPIRNTTLKYMSTLAVAVRTVNGVTGAGSGGFRIIVKGYQYTPAQLAALARGWNNEVFVQDLRRTVMNKPPLRFTFAPSGPLSVETWTSYPGGPAQGAIKVNPYWHFAYNAQATQPQSPYSLTNLTALGGGSDNVESPFQDLGFEFALNENAFILRGFGIRGVGSTPAQNLARFGWIVNGDILPEETGAQGIFVTAGVNDYAFGSVQPWINLPNVFFPIPRFPGQLLIYKDNAVPFIGANGSPIPAYSVMVALNGVLVERG